MAQRQGPLQVYNATPNVAGGGSVLHSSKCDAEKIVTVYVKNPVGADNPGSQTLTVQFLQSMDGVEYVDIGEQSMIDIPAGDRRLHVFNVDGINNYEIIAVPSGGGINNVPLKVYQQV